MLAPDAARAAARFLNTWRTWASGSPSPTSLPSPSTGTWLDTTSMRPVKAMAWLYPMTGGIPSGLTKCCTGSDEPMPSSFRRLQEVGNRGHRHDAQIVDRRQGTGRDALRHKARGQVLVAEQG